MENSFASNSILDEDADRFKNQLNSTELYSGEDDNGAFVQPLTPVRDLKFSPILRQDEQDKRSVFSRRMAMYKDRGESPLAKRSSRMSSLEDISSINYSKTDEHTAESGYDSNHVENYYNQSNDDSRSQPVISTPRNLTMSRSASGRVLNPFDQFRLENSHLSTLSPSLFEIMPSPKDKALVWSIEERSILMPANITEEEEIQASKLGTPDPVYEAKLRDRLDVYWKSSAVYIPSPDGPRPVVIDTPSVSSPSSASRARNTYATSSPNCRPNVSRRRILVLRNTGSQTECTIPPLFDFDFRKILGEEAVYEGDDGELEDEFNVSSFNTSLPRRLFSDESQSSQDQENILDLAEDVADHRQKVHDWSFEGKQTPLADFDLSPIKSDGSNDDDT